MTIRAIALTSLLLLLCGVERSRASAGWRPVTIDELRMTAISIGDPEADAAVLFREGELNDNFPDGTSLKLYVRIKVFNDRGRRYGEVQIPYRVDLGKVTDVKARTVRPDGGPIEVEEKDIYDRIVLRTAHSVWRAKVFSMPAVEAGSIIEYRYRITYPAGFRYFQLELQSDLFIKELRYNIQPQLASKLDVRWVSFNTPDTRKFTPVWNGAYEIKAENIKPFRQEPLMPPELGVKMWGWLYYSNELETDPDKYWRNYAERMRDRTLIETNPTRAIKRVVESITLSSEGSREKISRIYDYVQNEIQNIGLRDERPGEEESGGASKRNNSADETIRRRYGSPREINRLFVAMLRAVGLDARVAELTTRDENFFHRTFADAFQFNSEVTAVISKDGSVQFFDPGTRNCPLGMLAWEKEGVLALVYGGRDWRFVETPLSEASRSSEDHEIGATLEPSGDVVARATMKATGQRAMELRNEMTGATRDEQARRILALVREVLPGTNENESSVEPRDLTTGNGTAGASYTIRAQQFAERTEARLLLRPALLSHRDDVSISAPRRVNSIYFHYPRAENDKVVIDPPRGYSAENLPEPVDIDIGAARYHCEFAREGERVVYKRSLLINAISFTADQYTTVKAFFDRVHQADRTAVSFKQL
jgi:uncharacterized protein DUF3857/transglutaminase superfamily protein